jgi:EAL domain-containing protein (putative c-di-GMP-specific phosphodiesterase class I)
LAGELFGHEALLRPALGPQAISPLFAFGFAEQSGALVKFDRVCRTLHVLNFRHIYANDGLLFLNVDTRLLANVNAHGKVFERILHDNSVPTERMVIEIEERAADHDKQLVEAVEIIANAIIALPLPASAPSNLTCSVYGSWGRTSSNWI